MRFLHHSKYSQTNKVQKDTVHKLFSVPCIFSQDAATSFQSKPDNPDQAKRDTRSNWLYILLQENGRLVLHIRTVQSNIQAYVQFL